MSPSPFVYRLQGQTPYRWSASRWAESWTREEPPRCSLEHRPVADGQRVAGIYRRSVMLASGRYAMLDDGIGFSLVPWKPLIEPRLGKLWRLLCGDTTCHGVGAPTRTIGWLKTPSSYAARSKERKRRNRVAILSTQAASGQTDRWTASGAGASSRNPGFPKTGHRPPRHEPASWRRSSWTTR